MNIPNHNDYTPLLSAAGQGQYMCLETLIKALDDVNIVAKNDIAPLMASAMRNKSLQKSEKCIETIIETGAHVNVTFQR